MQVSQDIREVLLRIRESEDRWKALYMASWSYALQTLEPKFKPTSLWTQRIFFALPYSKNKGHYFIPEKLHRILTNKDDEFSLGHLQDMFSLLEELINLACPHICRNISIVASDFPQVEYFLLADKSYKMNKQGHKRVPLLPDMRELKLAKETRNCFIHGGNISDAWIKAYTAIKNPCPYTFGNKLPREVTAIQKIEDWHELIVKIANQIETEIQNL